VHDDEPAKKRQQSRGCGEKKAATTRMNDGGWRYGQLCDDDLMMEITKNDLT